MRAQPRGSRRPPHAGATDPRIRVHVDGAGIGIALPVADDLAPALSIPWAAAKRSWRVDAAEHVAERRRPGIVLVVDMDIGSPDLLAPEVDQVNSIPALLNLSQRVVGPRSIKEMYCSICLCMILAHDFWRRGSRWMFRRHADVEFEPTRLGIFYRVFTKSVASSGRRFRSRSVAIWAHGRSPAARA